MAAPIFGASIIRYLLCALCNKPRHHNVPLAAIFRLRMQAAKRWGSLKKSLCGHTHSNSEAVKYENRFFIFTQAEGSLTRDSLPKACVSSDFWWTYDPDACQQKHWHAKNCAFSLANAKGVITVVARITYFFSWKMRWLLGRCGEICIAEWKNGKAYWNAFKVAWAGAGWLHIWQL